MRSVPPPSLRPEHLPDRIRTENAARGECLDPGARRTLEASFDIDLSAIRVHDDPEAHRLSVALGADAFTTGTRLFFRRGAYAPDTASGFALLAHEITHAIQQSLDPLGAALDAASEPEAHDAARRVEAGRPAGVRHGLEAVVPVPSPVVVQRHASWEHRLLGDASSSDLNAIALNAVNRKKLLVELRDYLAMWRSQPENVTREMINARYPNIRTLQLRGSGLLVTYGELNTLPDYLADSASMDNLPSSILRPILQAVRQEGFYHANRLLGITESSVKFEGAVTTHLSNGTLNDIWESYWLNDLTADLPLHANAKQQHTDSYSALLARNACHFAPYSWYRWVQSYELALAKANEYHRTGDPATARDAWIHHGYADHFLQDSFAAGHLVNKTQVMQWFIEWATPVTKVPDWVEVQTMTTARQPGLAATGLYTPASPGGVRDPQTTEEQATKDARMAMSGVQADGAISREDAYQNYLTFLNNAVVQSSPLALHDYLNAHGVTAASVDQKTPFLLYGDNTMLDGGDGVRIASETAHMSQQSIQDVLDKGSSPITRTKIQNRFPTVAKTESGQMLPLREWNASMKNRAFQVFRGVHDVVIGSALPNMGHVSQDQSYFLVKLSYHGKEGYLGWDGSAWARLVERDHALKLRVRESGGQTYYGTEDGWWMSVGTAPSRSGYVGFYYWNNAGYPDWKYNGSTKRLTSSFSDRAGMSIRDDGFVYCRSDYPAADVHLIDV